MVKAESVFVLFVPVVQLADGFDAMTPLDEFVSPTANRAVIGVGVVPVSIIMGIFSSRKAGPRGHADRGGRVSGVEARSILSDRIDVRRSYDVVAVAARYVASMLVRHDKKDVRWNHLERRTYISICSARIGGYCASAE